MQRMQSEAVARPHLMLLACTGRLKRRERKTRHRRKCRGGKREKGKRGTKVQGWKRREQKTRHQSAGVEKARKCIYSIDI